VSSKRFSHADVHLRCRLYAVTTLKIFQKSIAKTDASPDQGYGEMLVACTKLVGTCTFVNVEVQPASDLIPLVLMTREEIPDFKSIVGGVIKLVRNEVRKDSQGIQVIKNIEKSLMKPKLSDSNRKKKRRELETELDKLARVTVSYREVTKSPYRMIEKALTKGPRRDYPDCSKIFDVYGCIIVCKDYRAMTRVIEAFTKQHQDSEMIVRSKNRWIEDSEGGWRDFMINIVVNGVVFEVQVVLEMLFFARKGLGGHKAYNQFRCLTEVFNLMDKKVMAAFELAQLKKEHAALESMHADVLTKQKQLIAAGSAAAARVVELETSTKQANDTAAQLAASNTAGLAELNLKMNQLLIVVGKDGGNGRVAALEAKLTVVQAAKAVVEAENAEWELNAEWLNGQLGIADRGKEELQAKVADLQAQLAARVAVAFFG
jgi:hypothetical protein